MTKSLVLEKAIRFALRIVKLYKFLKHCFDYTFKFLLGLKVTGPVSFKPLAVIVAGKVLEEL